MFWDNHLQLKSYIFTVQFCSSIWRAKLCSVTPGKYMLCCKKWWCYQREDYNFWRSCWQDSVVLLGSSPGPAVCAICQRKLASPPILFATVNVTLSDYQLPGSCSEHFGCSPHPYYADYIKYRSFIKKCNWLQSLLDKAVNFNGYLEKQKRISSVMLEYFLLVYSE